jgi:acetylglutamate/LysW-gamma-L-alpha-aminoadipate kinase
MGAYLTVVKCGGAAGVDPAAMCAGVAAARARGDRVVVVHGASAEAARLAQRLSVPLRELVAADGTSSRYTDADTLEILILALAGKVKPALVGEFARRDVAAVGLTGLDGGGLLRARRTGAVRVVRDGRPAVVRDDHSGRITQVRAPVLMTLLDAGIVPVVSPPAMAEDGRPVNVNADRIAADVAVALGADRLVLLTAAPGVLADPADETSVRDRYAVAADRPRDGALRGGMAVKVNAARRALDGGVPEVLIADGRAPETVRLALDGHGGTRIILAPAGSGALTDVKDGRP